MIEEIGRWWNDRAYQREHRTAAIPEGGPAGTRMMLTTDEWFPTFIGVRPWCDGIRRDCALCYRRCCPCRHSDRPARMPT